MYASNFPPRMGPGRPNLGPGGGMGPPGGPRMGPGTGMGRMDHGPGGFNRMDLGPTGGAALGGGPADVSNVTNDPNSSHCRVFVGNLNTHLMTKEDVERIFCNYGVITGISMHKGFAFVQFTSPIDARRAAVLEDGKVYANMRIDSNVASEPKNNAGRGQKRVGPIAGVGRQNSGPNNPAWQGSGPPNKKVRTETNPSMKRTLVTISSNTTGVSAAKAPVKKPQVSTVSKPTRTLSSPASKQALVSASPNSSSGDILICGRCRAMFPNVHRLAMHKKIMCVVKTNCKCQSPTSTDLEPSPLNCASCSLTFLNAWDLVQHCQGEHSLAIYKSSAQGQGDNIIKTEPSEEGKRAQDGMNGADDDLDPTEEEALLNEPNIGGAGDN